MFDSFSWSFSGRHKQEGKEGFNMFKMERKVNLMDYLFRILRVTNYSDVLIVEMDIFGN